MSAAEKLKSKPISERLDELPTLPAIVYELNRVIADPMASITAVEKIMANDQAMTMKVLKLANSAYYAIPGGVTTLARAIGYIGYESVHQLVLTASIIGALKRSDSSTPIIRAVSFEMAQFWKHSLGAAIASETIAQHLNHKAPSELFTCGLVHDMGKLAFFLVEPEIFQTVLELASHEGISFFEAELKLQVQTHVEIGQLLAQRWRLPNQIQNVVRFHHAETRDQRMGQSNDMNLVIDMVYLGNLFSHALKIGNSGHQKAAHVPREMIDRLQIEPDQLKDVLEKIRISLAKADGFLAIIGA